MKNDNFNLVYEDIIFKSNLNILCEEINQLYSIINEDNFLDIMKSIFDKISSFFSSSIKVFKKGYDAVIDFCKTFFKLTYVKDLMNKLGITDEILIQFINIVKGSLIVIPVAKIGYNVVTKTYKDIHDQDVIILIDRETFNDKSKKLFGNKSIWEKAWTIVKSGSKNLVIELIINLPLILKCVFGFAIASGFEAAINNPHLSTNAQDESEKIKNDVIQKLGENVLTQEQAMQIINNGFQYNGKSAPTLDMINKSFVMRNTEAFNKETGKLENVYATHYNKTNHGAADLFKGSRTTFDDKKAEYVTEKLSPTEYLYEMQKQWGVPTLGGAF